MKVSFDFETTVFYCDYAVTAQIAGTATVTNTEFGADADGNRGVKMWIFDDIEVDSVTLHGGEVVSFERLSNKERLYLAIEEKVLNNL